MVMLYCMVIWVSYGDLMLYGIPPGIDGCKMFYMLFPNSVS